MTFFNDATTLVRVRWYWCDQHAPTLPFPTVFCSRIWAPQLTFTAPLGEGAPIEWVDGSPPPWPGQLNLLSFDAPPDKRRMFITITGTFNTAFPPMVPTFTRFPLNYDAINDYWAGPPLPFFGLPGEFLQVIVQYTACFLLWFDGTRFWQQPTVIVNPPYVLYPGPAPLGSADAWMNGTSHLDPGVGADPLGYCVPAKNVAGQILLNVSNPAIDLNGLEFWSMQLTWTDPGLTLYPSYAYFGVPGTYTWDCPPGVNVMRLQMQGSGGGGGNPDSLHACGGGGGGSGAWAIHEHRRLIGGTSYFVYVDSGGLAASGFNFFLNGNPGGDGAPTRFGFNLYSAAAGKGGAGGDPTIGIAYGGAGGLADKRALWHRDGFAGGNGTMAPAFGLGGHSHFDTTAAGGLPFLPGLGDPGSGGNGAAALLDVPQPGAPGMVLVIYGFGRIGAGPMPGLPSGYFPGGFVPLGYFPPGYFPDGTASPPPPPPSPGGSFFPPGFVPIFFFPPGYFN